jgi:hypothetical protein
MLGLLHLLVSLHTCISQLLKAAHVTGHAGMLLLQLLLVRRRRRRFLRCNLLLLLLLGGHRCHRCALVQGANVIAQNLRSRHRGSSRALTQAT